MPVSRAAALRAVEAHFSVGAAARALGVPSYTLRNLGIQTRFLGVSRNPERKVALMHRVGMTLPEIASVLGITQRAAALAIRQAAGLDREGV
jgi:plasmid maintenance system antidote protein VapI